MQQFEVRNGPIRITLVVTIMLPLIQRDFARSEYWLSTNSKHYALGISIPLPTRPRKIPRAPKHRIHIRSICELIEGPRRTQSTIPLPTGRAQIRGLGHYAPLVEVPVSLYTVGEFEEAGVATR